MSRKSRTKRIGMIFAVSMVYIVKFGFILKSVTDFHPNLKIRKGMSIP